MTPSEISLVTGFAAAVAHAVAVSACLRFFRGIAPVFIHLLCAVMIGTMLPIILSLFVASFRVAIPFWPAASIFYGGVIAWLYAFSAVYKSITLGILQVLHTAPQGCVTIDDIARNFALPRFAERVDLLVASGLATRTESRYTITLKGQKAVHRLQLIQRIFVVSGSGFYLTS
jgi:predicted transcriptional regulator